MLVVGVPTVYGATVASLHITHHPVSDIAAINFHLFVHLEKNLVGKRFAIDADVKRVVTSSTDVENDLLFAGTQALVPS
jgi:hypothetical protein